MEGIESGIERLRRLLGLRVEEEVDSELAFHLEMKERDLVAAGHDPRAARERAVREFGDREAVARECRGIARRRNRKMSLAENAGELRQDGIFALRQLRRYPAVTAVAVLTLALGIGAVTAIFSAVNAAILRPLPFADPGRLLMLWEENAERGWHMQTAAPANALDWREQVPAFEDVAMYADFQERATLGGVGEPRPVRTATVTGNFFSVLGVRPALGRTLRDDETWRTEERVAVLSHRAWTREFGADPEVIGRTVRLDGNPYEVVGVMPASFRFPFPEVDFWSPFGWSPETREAAFFRRAHWVRPIARLRPGATVEEADAQLRTVARRLQERHPVLNRGMGAGLTPLQRFLVGDTRTPLLVLLFAVGVLLLLACANVGNLLLVRATARHREIAVRSALGASRVRIARQMIVESLVLSGLGGLAGLALGWAATRVLAAVRPPELLADGGLPLDWRVLAFTVAATALSGVLFGLVPAVWASRAPVGEALKEGGRSGGAGRGARRTASALVAGEVALAVLLVAGAGLLGRSFAQLQRVDPGFDPQNVLTASLSLPGTTYDTPEKAVGFFAEAVRRVGGLPGVESVGAVRQLPLTAPSWSSDFSVAGRGPEAFGTEVLHREVLPDYFRTLRVPLLRGRTFSAADLASGAPFVIVINESLARRHFPGEDPIGQRIAFDRAPDSTSTWRTVIGVVGDEHQTSPAVPPRIEIFAPLNQEPNGNMTLVMRTAVEPTSLLPAVRRLVAEMDPDLALADVRTLEAVRAESMARERFLMLLLGAFAAVALTLAVVGVYGVLAQAVRQRTREIGIRVALGAGPAQVVRLVVRYGLGLVLTGVVAGLAAAALSTRAMGALLFRVEPTDAATLASVALLLALAGLAAALVPALRASRTEPSVTLRAD